MGRGGKKATGAPVGLVLREPVKAGGRRREPGDEIELPAEDAQALIDSGAAVLKGQAEPELDLVPEAPEPPDAAAAAGISPPAGDAKG